MGNKSEKLTFWQKLGYGMGDFYGGGAGTLISFFYLVFLTDVVRISPGLAGTVILISKIYNSVTDPFEGVISDRTRTRLGRRRPYLLAGIPLVFISFFAMFYPVTFESKSARFLFVIATYLFFSTIVSIVMLNYSALQAEFDSRLQRAHFAGNFPNFLFDSFIHLVRFAAAGNCESLPRCSYWLDRNSGCLWIDLRPAFHRHCGGHTRTSRISKRAQAVSLEAGFCRTFSGADFCLRADHVCDRLYCLRRNTVYRGVLHQNISRARR